MNFIVLNAHVRKDAMAQVYNLSFHHKNFEIKMNINSK